MSLAKKGGILFGATLIQLVIGVVQVMILSRALGPEGIGRLTLLRQTFMLTIQTAGLGLSIAMIHCINKRQIDASVAFVSTLFFSTQFVLIGGVITVSLLLCFPSFFGSFSLLLGTGALLYILATHMKNVTYNLQAAKLNATKMALIRLVPVVLTVTAFCFLYLFRMLTVNRAVMVEAVLLGSLGVVVGIYFAKDIVSFRTIPRWSIIRQNMRLGSQAMMTDIGVVAGGWLTIMILKMCSHDFHQVGYFSRGLTLSLLVGQLVVSVAQLLYARWSKLEGDARKESVENTLNFVFIISLIGSIGIFIFAKPLVLFLFGASFLPAVQATRIIVLGSCLFNITRTVDPLFRSNNKAYLSVIIVMVGIAVNIPLALLLAPPFRANGSAIAFLISNIVMAVLALFFAKSKYGISLIRVLHPSPRVVVSVLRQMRRRRNS